MRDWHSCIVSVHSGIAIASAGVIVGLSRLRARRLSEERRVGCVRSDGLGHCGWEHKPSGVELCSDRAGNSGWADWFGVKVI